MKETIQDSNSNNIMLQAALNYLKLGFVPIPVTDNAKYPAHIKWGVYQKKRPTEQEVRKWWSDWPEANIALLTGEPSNLLVVDIDPGHDENWPPENHQLSSGLIVSTPREGTHHYFKHVPGIRLSAGKIAKGVDIRAGGSYIIACPSRVNGRSYRILSGSFEEVSEAPGWLQKDLKALEKVKKLPKLYAKIQESERNTKLTSLAGFMRYKGMSEDAIRSALIIENERRCEPPLSEAEVIGIARSIAKKKPSIDLVTEPELTDGSNARRFAKEHNGYLHYCSSEKAWYFWNGILWERDKKLHVEKLAQKFIRQQYAKASEFEDLEKRNKWMKHIVRWDSRKGMDSTIYLARSLDGVPVRLEEFDENDMVLNTQSGTIDFDQKEIMVLARDHSPADLITKTCPTTYDPSAKSPLWEKFLKSATSGDKELELFLQRSAGYCLVGTNPEEKFFFIYGGSGSGKSTFIETIKSAVGEYAVSINSATFLEQRYSGGAQPEVVKIRAARIVIANETKQGKNFNADLIKTLTGRDTIACRDLYSKPIEFKFGGKLWLISNFAPKVSIEDQAFMRRLLVIPFDNKIPENKQIPTIKTILTNPKISGAAILAWMVEGYLNYRDIGLAIPNSVLDSTQKYKEEINPIIDFIKDCCIVEPGNVDLTTTSAQLFGAYIEWANKNEIRYKMNTNKFGRCLTELKLESKRCTMEKMRSRVWIGIDLIR